MDMRGIGRTLRLTDFGTGKITKFTVGDLGPNWDKLSAVAAYRLNDFLSSVPYRWKVTSAFRTPEQNQRAGGSKNSTHKKGIAFDVWIFDPEFWRRDRIEFYVALARRVGFKGIGVYKDKKFLHVDVRDKPGSWGGIQTVEAGRKKTRFVSLAAALDQFSTGAAAVGAATLVGLFVIFFLASKS